MMDTSSPIRNPENSTDFCVEFDDDETNLLNSNALKVKDQNSRLLEVYKKTQINCMKWDILFSCNNIFLVQAGANVLLDLRKQREQLNRAGMALEDTEGDLAYSNRLMNKIFRRYSLLKSINCELIYLIFF